jgi:chemotaxis protein methyltransferase CheR
MPDTSFETLTTRPLRPREFEQIRRLAYDACGLNLRPGKEELVSARLGRLLGRMRLHTFDEYCERVRADASGEALAEMIDALTTNNTAFWREPEHFHVLEQKILPEIKTRRNRGPMRIWCAACATGEEAWTLAFILAEHGLASERCVLATDISRRALRTAAAAVYAGDRCPALPAALRQKYMDRGRESANTLTVRPAFRTLLDFRQINLVRPFHLAAAVPVIFCRNVMIYFDRPTQQSVVSRLAASLEPGGYLFVGHAESLTGVTHGLEHVCPAVYRRPGGSAT